jgi:hypothetical protein
MTDMDQELILKCRYSCLVHLCAAASKPLLLFTLGSKAFSLKVSITGHAQVIEEHNEAETGQQ